MSEVILTFVARRLDAESVALVFAARSPGNDPKPRAERALGAAQGSFIRCRITEAGTDR
jgi:hypothetical protein